MGRKLTKDLSCKKNDVLSYIHERFLSMAKGLFLTFFPSTVIGDSIVSQNFYKSLVEKFIGY